MSEIRSQATPARNELERSAIGWQQYISRALGCKPGQLTYQLEECIEKIEGLKPRTVNSIEDLEALPVNTCGVDDGDHYWIRHSKNWHCSCDGTDVEWSSENLWEEINLGGPGTFTVLFTPEDAG